jgi:hypothetical protein
MSAGAWGLAAAIVTAAVALIGTAVTAYLSYRSEKNKASTAELARVNERAERYWAKVEEQQNRIVALEARVYTLTLRLSQYEEVS